MEWLNFNSKEELQTYYKKKYRKYPMRELRSEIRNDIKEYIDSENINVAGRNDLIKITASTWKNLYLKIEIFKGVIEKINNKSNNKRNKNVEEVAQKEIKISNKPKVVSNISESEYFKSKGDELIFYILELSGKRRNEKLGVKDEYYEDKKLAEKWRKSILLKIHPDVCDNTKAAKALIQFEQLCKVIIR